MDRSTCNNWASPIRFSRAFSGLTSVSVRRSYIERGPFIRPASLINQGRPGFIIFPAGVLPGVAVAGGVSLVRKKQNRKTTMKNIPTYTGNHQFMAWLRFELPVRRDFDAGVLAGLAHADLLGAGVADWFPNQSRIQAVEAEWEMWARTWPIYVFELVEVEIDGFSEDRSHWSAPYCLFRLLVSGRDRTAIAAFRLRAVLKQARAWQRRLRSEIGGTEFKDTRSKMALMADLPDSVWQWVHAGPSRPILEDDECPF